MVWFDTAGILADPTKPREHRLNQPRILRSADLAWLADRLKETPIPTADDVRAAFAPATGADA